MPRTVSYEIVDQPDGRFGVTATLAPDKVYRRDDLATLAAAEEWIEGLRVLMAACGAPVVRAGLSGSGAGTMREPASRGSDCRPSPIE